MSSGWNPTLLIIEDDPDLLSMLKIGFERHGFTVLPAATVSEGLTIAGLVALDAVLSDFQLPDGDGLEICRTLQTSAPELRPPPFWLMTGSGLVSDDAVSASCVEGVFKKPFHLADVAAHIRAHIQQLREKT
jgi:DNA-binding response OmpR family regulator